MNSSHPEASLPGEELVRQGLSDLAENRVTDYSLLVLIAAPALKRLGIQIIEPPVPDLTSTHFTRGWLSVLARWHILNTTA